MPHLPLLVLMLPVCSVLWCTIISAHDSRKCRTGSNNLCISNATFEDWFEARKHCARLGGDLVIPNCTEVSRVSGGGRVWVGGGAFRVWTRDNSIFYFGSWAGCISDTVPDVDFQPSQNLSDCLQTCYVFKNALFNNSHCACSDTTPVISADDDNCVDPLDWDSDTGAGNTIHVFQMLHRNVTWDIRNCGRIQLKKKRNDYTLTRVGQKCDRSRNRYRSLCQYDFTTSVHDLRYAVPTLRYAEMNSYSTANSIDRLSDHHWEWFPAQNIVTNRVPDNDSSGQSLTRYGDSFLRIADRYRTWYKAEEDCAPGTLVKLEWESLHLKKLLYDEVFSKWMWVGVDPVKWRFIDVTTPVPESTTQQLTTTDLTQTNTSTDDFGHVTNGSILGVTSAMDGSQNTASGTYIGVGVTVGVLVPLGILILVWRLRKRSSPLGKPTPKPNRKMYQNNAYGLTPSDSNGASTMADQAPTYSEVIRDTTSPAQSVEELYAHVNKGVPAEATPQTSHRLDGSESAVNADRGISDFQPDDLYNKLSLQKVAGPLGRELESSEHSAVVSPDDCMYVNCSKPTVTSPYDHVVARGSSEEAGNEHYDQLAIPNVTRGREVDTSSVYNHVTGGHNEH